MTDSVENNAVFSGTNYAENYRKGRPIYPSSLIEAIVKFLNEKVTLIIYKKYIIYTHNISKTLLDQLNDSIIKFVLFSVQWRNEPGC
jgi:hypothetical protein